MKTQEVLFNLKDKERFPGIVYDDSFSGADILNVIRHTFPNQGNITADQLNYVMTMLRPSSYMLQNHYVRNGKQRMTFFVPDHDPNKAQSHRPYQYQIANDVYRDLVVIKSRQLGLSELEIAFMIWWADVHSADGVKCMYAFPTINQMRDFVRTRLDPVLSGTDYYRGITGGDASRKINSAQVKKIRDSVLLFRSSGVSGQLEGADVDMVCLDEYDHVGASAESSAEGSLSSSPFKMLRRFSTPTAPNTGIHRLYENSDQFEWLQRCQHCGRDNLMDFADYDPSSKDAGGNVKLINSDGIIPGRVIPDGAYTYVCKYCGLPIDRWDSGHWVARYPEITRKGGTRGYRISQMNAVWVNMRAQTFGYGQ